MPLTTTVTWPILTEGKKARASEVETKFSWLEGAQLPMKTGELTTGAYDIGSAAYKWKDGYFTSLVVGGTTMSSAEAGGIPIRGWVVTSMEGDTVSALNSYNVSSITRPTSGSYGVFWDTNFANANYATVISPFFVYAETGSSAVVGIVTAQYINYVTVSTVVYSGGSTNSAFNLIATGVQ